MKGHHEQLHLAIAYLQGRLELELEYYCHHQGLNPLEVIPLVGEALIGTAMDHLSAVLQAPRAAHSAAPKMEVANRAHGSRAQVAAKRAPGKAATDQVKKRNGYWSKMTPEERSKEMKRRMNKWDAKARKKWRNKAASDKKHQAHLAKQRIYQARHQAKKNGETPPPLPQAA